MRTDLLDYYPKSRGNLLPTFRDNLSVPSSMVKNLPKRHYSLRNNPEECNFWVITPYNLVNRCQCFGRIYCLHLHSEGFYVKSDCSETSGIWCNHLHVWGGQGPLRSVQPMMMIFLSGPFFMETPCYLCAPNSLLLREHTIIWIINTQSVPRSKHTTSQL
jgi:hypothetical protein